jgi:hypothetical protein
MEQTRTSGQTRERTDRRRGARESVVGSTRASVVAFGGPLAPEHPLLRDSAVEGSSRTKKSHERNQVLYAPTHSRVRVSSRQTCNGPGRERERERERMERDKIVDGDRESPDEDAEEKGRKEG